MNFYKRFLYFLFGILLGIIILILLGNRKTIEKNEKNISTIKKKKSK